MYKKRAPDRLLDQASKIKYRWVKRPFSSGFARLHALAMRLSRQDLVQLDRSLVARRLYGHCDIMLGFHALPAASGSRVAVQGQW